MNDQDRAALAIRTAADLLTSAAALVELDEKADALRQLRAVRDALHEAAKAGEDMGQLARVLDAALAPTLTPGLEIGAAAFNSWQQQTADALPAQHFTADPRAGWTETDYMANGEECPDVFQPGQPFSVPDSWTRAVQETAQDGPKTAEQWQQATARARAEDLN